MDDSILRALQNQGDAEADLFVASLAAKSPGLSHPSAWHAMLTRVGKWEPEDDPGKLCDGTHCELRDFIHEPVVWPHWSSRERLDSAQRTYQVRRLRARLVLAHASLPVCYLHAETARTLAGTGQLLQHPRRRIFETVRFVETVMRPGSFGANGMAGLWIRKVRLTHALVRAASAGVGRKGDPMPLDQVEVSFVLQTFGHLLAEGLAKLSMPFSVAERGNHLHAWSVIGSMLGVRDELLPEKGERDDPDAGGLYAATVKRLLAPGDPFEPNPEDTKDEGLSGRLLTAALCAALVQTTRERLPEPLMRFAKAWPWVDEAIQSLPRVLIRRLSGVPIARHLRVGRAPLLHWALAHLALSIVDIDRAANYPIDSEAPRKRATVSIPAYISL